MVCAVLVIPENTQTKEGGCLVIWLQNVLDFIHNCNRNNKNKEKGHILAGRWGLLALKAVKEAPRVVTLLVTNSILKEIPAGNTGGAVIPRLLPVERAVASIPLTFMVVTLIVTHFIPRMLLTLQIGAGWSAWCE